MANPKNTEDELYRAFQDGSVFTADDAALNRYLSYLSSNSVPNDTVRHREVIRGLTINTIKTFRFVDAANRANKRYTLIIIFLSTIAIAVSGFSIWESISASRQMQQLIAIQKQQLKQFKSKHSPDYTVEPAR